MDKMQERIMLVAMLTDEEWEVTKMFAENLIETRRRFVAASMEDVKKEEKSFTKCNRSWWEMVLILFIFLFSSSNSDKENETRAEQNDQDVQ